MFQLSYIGYNYHENSDFIIHRPNGSGNYLFLLFKSEVDLILNEEVQRLLPGAMILFDPTFPQFYYNRIDGFTNDWLHIETHEFEDFIKGLNFPLNTPFYLYPSETLHLMIHNIEKEYLRLDFAYEESIHSQIMALFIFLARNFHQKDKHQNDPYMEELENQFRQIRANIISRHWESWTVDSMASLSGHSRSRFSYLYHHFFRISPKEDLILERIQMAKYLLKNSDLTISQVSQKVGYDNIYHFSKLFKKNTGLSPSRYRT